MNKPLKILHLSTHINIGGISSYMLMVSSRMTQNGHQVTVVSSGGMLKEDFEKKGIRTVDFPIQTKNALHPKLIVALPELIRFVKKEKFDVMHAHTRVTQVLGNMLSKATGVPLVATAHGFYKRRLFRRIFDGWGKKVIAISDGVALDLEKTHKVKPSRIRTVYNAIDLVDFQKKISEKDSKAIRKEYGIGEDTIVIGSISRLVADKGHTFLIEAFQELRKDFENLFLIILGDGRERANLEEMIQRKGLTEHVALIPGLRDATVVFSVMDIFAHPATYREGFGLSMVEAMAAKKPVVMTDIPAINTIIENGVNGFMVKPADSKKLAAAIRFIIENKDKSKAVAENAFNQLIEKYSIDRMVAQIEAVYREVL